MKTSGGVRIARFGFDALGRRITETDNGPAKDFYYSDKWQLLEERHTGAVNAQYIWSPVYVDALIVRDRNNDANPDVEERLYVQQDANWNVTAVTDKFGAVQERYVYDPYGVATRLTASWGMAGADALRWLYLHQGGRFDANLVTAPPPLKVPGAPRIAYQVAVVRISEALVGAKGFRDVRVAVIAPQAARAGPRFRGWPPVKLAAPIRTPASS